MCGQGTSNQSAIKELIEETKRRNYLRNGKEWRENHFEIDGEAVIPIFDSPHLLKGKRNNF
jgi:hypothetical protein